MSDSEFYELLKAHLATSNEEQRNRWAQTIITHGLNLSYLADLLDEDRTTAMRFSWLLTNIGLVDPDTLSNTLPYLFQKSRSVDHFDFQERFARYWSLVGIPEEDEASAVDLLFGWLTAEKTMVSIRVYAMDALYALTRKYPELTPEFRSCLEDVLTKHSGGFQKRAQKVLNACIAP